MSLLQDSGVKNASNELMPLEELAFTAAILFFFGSIISLYIAYKNLKNSSSSTRSILELIP